MPADDFYHYRIDSNRIFSTGPGYGAMFTNALGWSRGDTLRAIGPVAGMPPNAYGRGTATGVGHVGARIAHGENDTSVDSTTGGIASPYFRIGQNGCSPTVTPIATTPTGCVEYQDCQPDLPVAFCVHHEGHNWPNPRCGCDGGVCFDAGSAIWPFITRCKQAEISRRVGARIGADVRVSRTLVPDRPKTTAFFSIFSSHERGDFL